MTFDLATLLQVLILAIGIYLLLAFLRSTRGSGLVRGLGLMLIVGVYGLWGVADALGWFELKLVIQGLLGFVFVILAIVFQPELRRGIVSLGENPLLGRLLRSHKKDVVAEVAAAAISMARKKQGALIAFERKTPLDTYVEGGVTLDAEVNRYLLDSLFHHGSALHDGAAIIRGDRVVAAACLFPLTENIEISKSTGTRHRAALGLTEETDAVTLAVSEETGRVAICKDGRIERGVPRKELEERLQKRLGKAAGEPEDQEEEGRERGRPWLVSLATEHLGQKLAALVLAGLVFYGAHQDLRFPRDKELAVVAHTTGEVPRTPVGKLVVVLEEGWRLQSAPESVSVRFEGTRDELEVMGQVGGLVRVQEGVTEPSIDAVEWVPGLDPGVTPYWREGREPRLEVIGVARKTVELTPDMVTVHADNLAPAYEARVDELALLPRTVEVRGPRDALEDLDLRFEDVVLDLGHTQDVERTLALTRELFDAGIELLDQVTIKIPVVLREEKIADIRLPITLEEFRASGHDFLPPDEEAVFAVYARGLLSGSESKEIELGIKSYVQETLYAFVNVDKIPAGTNTGRVEHYGLQDWREELLDQVEGLTSLEPEDDLRVELVSDPRITLTTKDEE